MTFVFAVILLNAPIAFGADELPKGDKIMDRYVEVTGGKAAYEKHKNSVTTANMEFAPGMKAKMMVYRATSPDRFYMSMEIPNMGTNEQGIMGDVVWDKNPMTGPSVKEGPEKAHLQRMGAFNAELNWRKLYKEAKTLGLEDVEGKPAYKVELTPNEGKPEFHFFDKESGLLVKTVANFSGQMGEMQVESFYSDYKDAGGTKSAHAIKQKFGPQQVVMTVEKVEYNADIPANRFDLPAEVKAIVEKKGASKEGEKKSP